ncbi:hypothetical protein MTR_1g038610 [Medicago truncatula]|uniref:Uncharacterized protein n=1 Tax=Medicago truncatula TaxID=3880 RepID=G7IBE9_MEDTR|nr:hypothetical protein MTR_1g038610 [Medicago truncatula]
MLPSLKTSYMEANTQKDEETDIYAPDCGRTCAIERRKIKGRREKEEAVLNNTHVEEKK